MKLSSEIKQVEGSELTNQLSGDEYCVKFILLLLRASLILMWILHSINSFGVTGRVRKKRNLSDTSFELITSYTIPIFVFFLNSNSIASENLPLRSLYIGVTTLYYC